MMRSWQLLMDAAQAKTDLQRADGCRRWAERMRRMAEMESQTTARGMLLRVAEDYERIADSLDSIDRSKQWIQRGSA